MAWDIKGCLFVSRGIYLNTIALPFDTIIILIGQQHFWKDGKEKPLTMTIALLTWTVQEAKLILTKRSKLVSMVQLAPAGRRTHYTILWATDIQS